MKMVPKNIVSGLCGAALLVANSGAIADGYRPDEFFSLDLSRAVLSPNPLGPPTEFAPVPVEAKSDHSGLLGQSEAKKVVVEPVAPTHHQALSHPRERRVVHEAAAKPHGFARSRLAHRHGNPLNAQAMDMRVQKWPCNPDSGGICNWR